MGLLQSPFLDHIAGQACISQEPCRGRSLQRNPAKAVNSLRGASHYPAFYSSMLLIPACEIGPPDPLEMARH